MLVSPTGVKNENKACCCGHSFRFDSHRLGCRSCHESALRPVAVWSWTGFYIGGHVGAGWGTTESSIAAITPAAVALVTGLPLGQNSRSGVLGGGQIGYNWQSGWAVFGVQGDIAGLDVKGTHPCLGLAICSSESNWLATVSGRFGGVVADRTLVYVKGGAAWLQSDHRLAVPAGFGPFPPTSGSTTAVGWVGFGAEYAFSQNWSAFIEYDYMDFGKKTGVASTTGTIDVKEKLSVAKVGVNYKF
ncbi:porin family protein [Bradyrhizobium sp. 44]|uniref:outer membrane protein n=1 Tax=unclassified Bradyrhizobium TaxID=2631580 RepID=UPI001FF7370E|nr:outer membrane protein [Bradyrhizobium sp. 40]MCK1287075.1 porin family protein [Bradyrhizobium sp. 44]UPJ44073.1 porin family protein [Bradyrhizobium sp. 40]